MCFCFHLKLELIQLALFIRLLFFCQGGGLTENKPRMIRGPLLPSAILQMQMHIKPLRSPSVSNPPQELRVISCVIPLVNLQVQQWLLARMGMGRVQSHLSEL